MNGAEVLVFGGLELRDLCRNLEGIVLAQIKRGPNKGGNLPELFPSRWEWGEGINRFSEDLDEFMENRFPNRILRGVKAWGSVQILEIDAAEHN